MIPMGCAGWLAFVALLFYIFEDCIEFLFLAECGQDEKKRLIVDKMKKNGSSDQRVPFFKPVRPLFNPAGHGESPPNPLSLWERARVREALLWCGHLACLIVMRASCLLDCGAGILPAL